MKINIIEIAVVKARFFFHKICLLLLLHCEREDFNKKKKKRFEIKSDERQSIYINKKKMDYS